MASKSKTITRGMLKSVETLSNAEAAKALGSSKTTIFDARARYGMQRVKTGKGSSKSGHPKREGKGATTQVNADGSLVIETQDTVPQTKEHIVERMRARGFEPEAYQFSYSFGEWEAQTPNGVQTLYSARASATERKKSPEAAVELDMPALEAIMQSYQPVRGEAPNAPGDTFVFNFADPQWGKTDLNGGSAETLARYRASLDHACAILDESPTSQIIWADLGDGIENFCNTSSQRQTNDLNLVEQVRILRRTQVEGLLRLSEYAPIIHASVPSNHAQNRVGFQAPASTSHDDWGIEVQYQLEELFDAYETPYPIEFLRPDEHMESIGFETMDGTRLGMVHGHRSNNQNSLESWWAGQALGEQPTAQAQILLVGHFHNYSLRSVGKQKYIIVTPSLDNGSSWFTVSRGNVATAGVLTMRVRDGVPTDMRIV